MNFIKNKIWYIKGILNDLLLDFLNWKDDTINKLFK